MTTTPEPPRPPVPPFTRETAMHKVRLAEDAWNRRDPQRVALDYTSDGRRRNRVEFAQGRVQIIELQKRKRARELGNRLIKELWADDADRIAVRFVHAWHDDAANWFRSHGNQNREFAARGFMAVRHASINHRPIATAERKFHWPLGRRPDEHPRLANLGL